ncbi:MAG: hypothetical protein HY897_15525, partial [Deltaproteobacteria bacterium]|nr:hypothetical protein [Deltaproteobacteria bacterium]
GGCYSTFWKDGLGNEKDGPFWAGRGYVAVAVQYRYPQNYFAVAGSEAPEDDLAKLPAPVQDMRCGIRWMRATAEHGLDRLDDERIFAYGGSGGGMWSLTMLAESGRGVDLAWYDNPACPYNDASTLPGGADTASVQGAVAGFPRVDDRPEYLDRTAPDGWPPKHPSDWVGQNGEKFRSNYWMKQLKDTLNHMFGAKDFPDVYAADANVKDRVDRIAVIPKAKAAWGPVFIKHSVFDDLNYYQGTVDLVSALKAAGHPEHLRTVIPVSRAWCAPPLPKGTPKALRSTLECSGHDDMPLYGSWDGDDPVDEMDLNNDGEPDYDSLASFCTLKRFLEVHHPAGRPVHVPADWD